MRLSQEKLKKLCDRKGLKINALLERARVSRTAYYSLLRKESVLPRSIDLIAEALGVAPSSLLEEGGGDAAFAQLVDVANAIVEEHPKVAWENVWHTLVLLQEQPVERMKRGLLRAQKPDLLGRGSEVPS